MDELGAGREAKLLHDVRPVRFGCSYRDEQRLRDVLVGVAGSEQPQHLLFPRGEGIAGRELGGLDVGGRLGAGEPGAEHRVQVLVSCRDFAHGGKQLLVGGLL